MTTLPTNTTVVHPLAFAKVVALQSCCDCRTINRIILVTVVVVVTVIIVASWLLWPLCGGCGSGGHGHHVAIMAAVLQRSLQWYLGSRSLVIVAVLCFLRLQVVLTLVLSLAIRVESFKWWSFSHARPHFTLQLSLIVIFLGLVSWNTVALGVG